MAREEASEDGALSAKQVAGFATGSASMGVFTTTPGLLLLYYMTDVHGIAPALAGLVIFVVKSTKLAADPLAGRLSDHMLQRFRTRLLPIAVGGIGYACLFALLFSPGIANQSGCPALFIAFAFLLGTLFFSLFSASYVTVPAEAASRAKDRSRLVATRSIALMLGVLVGGAGAPLLVGQYGYGAMALVLSAIMLVGLIPSLFAVASFRLPKSTPSGPFLAVIRSFFRDARLRNLVIANGSAVVVLACFFASLPYLSETLAGATEETVGIFVLAVIGAAFLSIPLWSRLGEKIGLECAFLWSVGLLGCVCAAMLLLSSVDQFLIAMVVAGIAFGGIQLCPYVMLADASDAWARRRNLGVPAAFAGIWTAIEGSALAVGPSLIGILLSLNNYQPSADQSLQTHAIQASLVWLYLAVPMLSFLGAWAALSAMRRSEIAPHSHPSPGDFDNA